MLSFILNLPYTIAGLIGGLASLPKSVKLSKHPFAFVITVRGFWWTWGFHRHARAMAFGNVVLLGPKIEDGDLEHELIHVRQCEREPFIHPFLYLWESWKHGYRNNKYEKEAYEGAGNIYRE